MGISLYVIFAYVGQHIPESFQHPFCSISRYSYPTYLLHHVILEQICSRFENIKLSLSETYFLFIVCIAVIMITTILFYNLYERIRNETKNMADIYESKIQNIFSSNFFYILYSYIVKWFSALWKQLDSWPKHGGDYFLHYVFYCMPVLFFDNK